MGYSVSGVFLAYLKGESSGEFIDKVEVVDRFGLRVAKGEIVNVTVYIDITTRP